MSDHEATTNDAIIEMDLLPPRWLDIQDEITSTLASITASMKRLDALHAKHVLPGFDDESVKAKEEREIEGLTQEITRGFAGCQRGIKRIEAQVLEQKSSRGDLGMEEEVMARNLQISLATRVGEVSSLFRKRQAAYLKKLRALGGFASPFGDGRSGTPIPSSSAAQNPYNDPALADSVADTHTAQATLTQTAALRQRQVGGRHDSTILHREREIEKIAQGVIDLSTLFQEMNAMVIDQGSLLDRIDYNVERTRDHTKEAEKELKVATGYQKKGVKRKVILLLILLVVGMFILVLIKPRRSGEGGNETPATPIGDGVQPPNVQGNARQVVREAIAGSSRSWPDWKKRRRRR